MTNKFIEYLTNIGPSLANKIPCVDGDNLEIIKKKSGDSMFITLTDYMKLNESQEISYVLKALVMMIYH